MRQARESGRLNPRRAPRARMRGAEDFGAMLERLEQAVAETRSMARTHRARRRGRGPAASARAGGELLARAGDAVSDADAGAIGDDPRGPRGEPPTASTAAGASGALLVNLRNILDAMDAVADAQPVSERAPAPGRLGRFARERVGGRRRRSGWARSRLVIASMRAIDELGATTRRRVSWRVRSSSPSANSRLMPALSR